MRRTTRNNAKTGGVWYTPQAVVSCIVKTVDEILQAEFNLPMGLADTSKITVERSIDQSKDKRFSDGKKKETVKIHKVQLLDPATGTGTFLAEAVSRIHDKFNGQAGMWQGYVGEHLLPRLNGFELLMTSYTMAHLKLDWILTETGYKADDNERLRVFLTNRWKNTTRIQAHCSPSSSPARPTAQTKSSAILRSWSCWAIRRTAEKAKTKANGLCA